MTKVALVRCESYKTEAVDAAVAEGIDLLGGVGVLFKKKERVLLKPNVLAGDLPARCTTTHPAVFAGIAKVLQAAGVTLTYGDSPGFGSTYGATKKAELAKAADALGIPLADFEDGKEITFEDGKQQKKFVLANAVLEADTVVSVPKMKTHGLERFTGAVKNQLGCVPGLLKAEFHVRMPDALEFGKMLLDLNRAINPRLYVMDGITAMEGNGPRGGTPKQMNVLLFSTDPVALDATACRMIGLNPMYVPTIQFAKEFEAGVADEKEITIVGAPLASFIAKDFECENSPVTPFKAKGIARALNNLIVPKPYIKEEVCVKCGICIKSCPANPKAVDWPLGEKDKVPVYRYSECIRCYCCQEMCPESAITLRVPFLRKVLRALRIIR